MQSPLRSSVRHYALSGLVTALLLTLVSGCSQTDPGEAPYEGHRPLEILKVTQNFNPEIQWVGGRVAAVGVNAGHQAALDSTLVWLRTAPGNEISSVVRIDDDQDWELVESFGGTPLDALEDKGVYTFWLADTDAFENGLHPDHLTPFTFTAKTDTLNLILNGRSGGGLGVSFFIFRDETITEDRLVVTWSPSDVAFRRLAIRRASVGGWTDLIWHLLVSSEQPPSITSPLFIGEPPDGVVEVVQFAGFQPPPSAHILWAVTDEWTENNFGLNAPGYAWYQIFASNFE